MPKITNENKESIEKKLKYIDIDLDKIPGFLKESKQLEYRPLKTYDENIYKVYKYISISKIQILLTPTNRLNTIKEKYSLSSRIYSYLNPINEEDIIRHTTFLKMLSMLKIEEIEKIEKEQKNLNKNIPFKVKFHENYLWQIYYSDIVDTYFMLVPTEDLEYASFFYLLKKQIECDKTNKDEKIFVPISHEEYSNKYLKKSEFADIEKYLWLFTKQWPLLYEVYDKNDNLSIQIVGETVCYENIQSVYKIELHSKEEANRFYKLIKALFILQTQLSHYHNIKTKINKYGKLEFECNNNYISYNNLFELLNERYINAKKNIEILEKEEEILRRNLEDLKIISNKKDKEYIQKEKVISTYLEYKRTFLGKIKYYFKLKKIKDSNNIEEIEFIEKEEIEFIEKEKIEFIEKKYYTLEDILKIYKDLDSLLYVVKNLKLDLNALKNKIENMELKIKNATLYIKEIDTHEKSIFEFWKFANKDDKLLLNKGQETENIKQNKIEKVYNYTEDLEEIGMQIDKIQRNILSKSEEDSIYIASTELLNILNYIKNEKILSGALDKLKKEIDNERMLFDKEKFDIFGRISDDITKIKTLGNKKHRESKKNKFKILDIYKDMELNEFKEKLQKIKINIDNGFKNLKLPISIPVYIASINELDFNGLGIFNIIPEDEINRLKNENKLNLYRINLKKDMPVIFLSNIIYYDNYNKTLPVGMNVSNKCLLDMSKFDIKLESKTEFRINNEINEYEIDVKTIYVYEYEVEVRK